MKRTLFICILIASVKITIAQTARISLNVTDRTKFAGSIDFNDPSAKFNKTENPLFELNDQKAAAVIAVSQPHYVSIACIYSTGQRKYSDKYVSYRLFISPGDDLRLNIDLTKGADGITVTGKGSNNNQPNADKFTDIYSGNELRREKSPYPVIAVINNEQQTYKKLLDVYIAKNNPTEAFINVNRFNVMYYTAAKYFFFCHADLNESHYAGPWKKVQDSVFSTIKLNNDAALIAANYTSLISEFLERTKERLWYDERKTPEKFYKEWYDTDTTTGKKLFAAERTSILQEKIIGRYFSGKVAEYLYRELLRDNLNEQDYHNIDKIYAHFKEKYPNSEYLL